MLRCGLTWWQRAQVGDNLPSLLLRQRSPRRHPLIRIAVAKHPAQFAVRGMANAHAAQAGARRWMSAPVGVSAVTFGTVFCKKRLASGCGLWLMPERIGARPVFVRDPMEPFAVKLTGRAHLGGCADEKCAKTECRKYQRSPSGPQRFKFHLPSFYFEDNATEWEFLRQTAAWKAVAVRRRFPSSARLVTYEFRHRFRNCTSFAPRRVCE
jgi:hypothetical protein